MRASGMTRRGSAQSMRRDLVPWLTIWVLKPFAERSMQSYGQYHDGRSILTISDHCAWASHLPSTYVRSNPSLKIIIWNSELDQSVA
jgi:hypothetical protein